MGSMTVSIPQDGSPLWVLFSVLTLPKEQQPYRELGPGHAQEQAVESSKRWAIRRLEQLGYQVTLQPAEVA